MKAMCLYNYLSEGSLLLWHVNSTHHRLICKGTCAGGGAKCAPPQTMCLTKMHLVQDITAAGSFLQMKPKKIMCCGDVCDNCCLIITLNQGVTSTVPTRLHGHL